MRFSVRVHGMTGAVFIAVQSLIVRMRIRCAFFKRDLMLAADAMLQRSCEHALDGQCYRDDPKQQEARKIAHAGGSRIVEKQRASRAVQEHIVQRVYSTMR